MRNALILIWSHSLRVIVKFLAILTGKSGGKFAQLLPPQQTYISNYCGYKFNIDTTYPIESCIWLSGNYEVVTTKFFQKVLRQNDIFIDIGANCGAITLLAASIISTGKIYAFEPGIIHARLQANIDLNPQLKNIVKIIPLGLGATKGELFYHEDPNYRGNGNLSTFVGTPIQIVTLDAWVHQEQLNKIDVIKIDTEGMEYEIFLGGKHTLQTYQPIIYFETLSIFFNAKPYTIKTVYEFLTNIGYQIINPTKSYQQINVDKNIPPNSVAIPQHQLERLT